MDGGMVRERKRRRNGGDCEGGSTDRRRRSVKSIDGCVEQMKEGWDDECAAKKGCTVATQVKWAGREMIRHG